MQPIAVIGLSCLFPEANTPAQYWENLLQEKDSCTYATKSNLDAEPSRFYAEKKGIPDKFYCARGGYIRDFSLDPEGFLLPPESIEKLGCVGIGLAEFDRAVGQRDHHIFARIENAI